MDDITEKIWTSISQIKKDIDRCLLLLKESKFSIATSQLTNITVRNPKSVDAWNALGLAHAMSTDWENAANAYLQSLRLDSKRIDTRRRLSFVWRQLRRYRDVLQTLTPIKEYLSGDPQTTLLYAEAYFSLGSYLEAAELSESVIQSHPLDPVALQVNGESSMHLGEYKIAIKRLNELIKRHPDEIQFVEKLAYCLWFDEQPDAAREKFEVFIESIDPSNDNERIFHEFYNDGLIATKSPPISSRRQRFQYLFNQLLETQPLRGDVAECGVYRGLSSYIIGNVIQKYGSETETQDYMIFDSFEGLSKPSQKDVENLQDDQNQPLFSGAFRCSLDYVKENLKSLDNVRFYKGWIPDRFEEVRNNRFRFVHLDVDLYEPRRDSLEFFFPRLVQGGKIVCDDYSWVGAKAAVDEFCTKLELEVTTHNKAQIVIQKT